MNMSFSGMEWSRDCHSPACEAPSIHNKKTAAASAAAGECEGSRPAMTANHRVPNKWSAWFIDLPNPRDVELCRCEYHCDHPTPNTDSGRRIGSPLPESLPAPRHPARPGDRLSWQAPLGPPAGSQAGHRVTPGHGRSPQRCRVGNGLTPRDARHSGAVAWRSSDGAREWIPTSPDPTSLTMPDRASGHQATAHADQLIAGQSSTKRAPDIDQLQRVLR